MMSERAPSMEKMPTVAQALAGVPISPSNNTLNTLNTINNLATQASSIQVKANLSKSQSRATSVKKYPK